MCSVHRNPSAMNSLVKCRTLSSKSFQAPTMTSIALFNVLIVLQSIWFRLLKNIFSLQPQLKYFSTCCLLVTAILEKMSAFVSLSY